MQSYLGLQALSFFGEGVLATTIYPNPFPITRSGTDMTITVGNGIGFDPNGQITEIPSVLGTSPMITIPTASPSFARWDLLVIRYRGSGQTSIPKPSDPISSVFLNLVDDFELAIVEGTPAGTPVYPSKGALDIILAGLQVPAGALVATDCFLDLSIREIANPFKPIYPDFTEEAPVGVINGANQMFTLSKTPLNAASVFLFRDGLPVKAGEFSLAGNTITMNVAPATGQSLYAQYVSNLLGSPLAGAQETPSGVIDGTNRVFTLLGQPADQRSSKLYIDGGILPIDKWTLTLGPVCTITINVGFQPAIGQDIYFEYFINPATVGIGGTGPINNGSNIGGFAGIFKDIVGTTMRFKTLRPGTNITIIDEGDDLKINSSAGATPPTAHGNGSSPIAISPTAGVAADNTGDQVWWIAPASGAVPITSSTQIQPGTTVGQRITLKGTSAVNYYQFSDGNGLSLNGPLNLTNNQAAVLSWDGSVWSEDTRRY